MFVEAFSDSGSSYETKTTIVVRRSGSFQKTWLVTMLLRRVLSRQK